MTKGAYDLEVAGLPREEGGDPPEKGVVAVPAAKRDVDVPTVSRFRVILPQVLASTAKNLLLLDLGLSIAFPTIAIAALQNAAEGLSLTDEQASWLGSITFICQPLGSLVSGAAMEPLGRKRSMILVNFPHILGWFLMYGATTPAMLYVGAIIMGLGVGFMEAPIITYVGEISQPELRGILTSYSGIFVQLGFFVEYLLGTFVDWRTAAAISAAVPIFTVLAITQVPETPMWLLSKGRVEEAEASLCWLRGWVQPAAVKEEFGEMLRYSKEMNRKKQKAGEAPSEGTLVSSDGFLRRLKELGKPQTLRPMILVGGFFFFHHASGLPGIRPYIVNIFEEFGLPLDAHWATVVFALIGIIGNITCMVAVRWAGKRPLSLISLGCCASCCLLLGLYAFHAIVPGTHNAHQANTWAPLVLFIALSFAFNIGVGPIPWMLLSEVFPFKSRGLASGISAAVSYVMGFVVSKTFLSLKTNLHLHGVFWVYGFSGCVGFVFLYIFLRETEGKTLEDIEDGYKKPKKEVDGKQLVLAPSVLTLSSENGIDNPIKVTDSEITELKKLP